MFDLLVFREGRTIVFKNSAEIARQIPKPTTTVPSLLAPSVVLGKWLRPSEALVKKIATEKKHDVPTKTRQEISES